MNIAKIEDMAAYFYEVRKQLITDAENYFFDNLFVNSIVVRAYQINKGFIELTNSGNFLSACPLVRIQLETLLRCYGALIADGNTYIKRFIEGKKLDNQTFNGKQLTYTTLVDLIANDINATELPRIYNEGNRYLHPTDYSFKASVWKQGGKFTIQNLEGNLYEEKEMESIKDDMFYINVCYIPILNRYLRLYYANIKKLEESVRIPISDKDAIAFFENVNTIFNSIDRS